MMFASINQMEELTMANPISGETLIGELVRNYPETIDILLSVGMHCLGCPASQAESVAEACMVHGISADEVVDALNARIAENAK